METNDLPCIVHLRNGAGATLALAEASDRGDLLRFFRAMPEEDRLVLKDEVTTADWLDRFLAKLRSGDALSVIGRVGGAICGEGTLYRTLSGWSRHVSSNGRPVLRASSRNLAAGSSSRVRVVRTS
jgi:hypothetical protein